MDRNDRIKILFDQFCNKTSSLEKTEELFALIADPANDEFVKEYMQVQNAALINDHSVVDWDWEHIRLQALQAKEERTISSVHRIHFLRTAWFRYAAAVLIILGIGAYLWQTTQKESTKAVTAESPTVNKEILPGSEKAILTLSDGRKIELNNNTSGTITDGSLSIKNNSGELVYSPIPSYGGVDPGPGMSQGKNSDPGAGVGRGETMFNTMSTPRGGQYRLILSDGSTVWLNAASSITYPITFTEKTREVTISGEAYFEIAKNKSKPFIVKTISDRVEVLGTSFNINSYRDEPFVKTSLIEGSIAVHNQNAVIEPSLSRNKTILKPGEAYTNGKIIKTNIEQDIAWKNGFFAFNEADMQTVMRELSRWYDIDISYEGKIPERKFNGKIGRQLTLAQVLKGLSKTGINYRLEDNKRIIIIP